MFETLLLTVGAVSVIMGGMAVGVLFSNKPLKGSCGGQGDDCACAAAGKQGACEAPIRQRLAPEAERVVREYVPPRDLISLQKLK